MSDARESGGDDCETRSHQEMMLSLLKVLVDSQAKQSESHAITLHQIATTQHQMMELLKSSRSNYKDDEEKHKSVENPSLSCLNQPAPALASLPTLVAPEKHMAAIASDHATDNLAVNTNFSSISVYEEEITHVIPSYDLNEQHLQPFEHRQQLQLSDLAGHQTIIDEELPSGEREGQLVWDEYNQLYEAAIAGDWDKASKYLEENPEAITKAITKHPYTVLDVAIIKMTDLKFVEEIVKLMPPEALEKITADGVTALHRAALHGYAKAAELIVNKNPKTTQIVSGNKNVPLENAIQTVTAGQKETVEYLYSVTRHEHPSPFSGHRGAKLLCKAIEAGFNSIALSLVQRFPELVTERTKVNNVCGLELMAERPFAFASGAKLTFWQRCIYSLIHVNTESSRVKLLESTKGTNGESTLLESTKGTKGQSTEGANGESTLLESTEGTNGESTLLESTEGTKGQSTEGQTNGGEESFFDSQLWLNSSTDEENQSFTSDSADGDITKPPESSNVSIMSIRGKLIKLILGYLMPSIKQVPPFKQIYEQLYNQKLMHRQAYELVKCMLTQLDSRMSKQEVNAFFRESSVIKTAMKHGTIELVKECLKTFPYQLIWVNMGGQTMMTMATAERNEMTVDLIWEATKTAMHVLISRGDKKGNTILHFAAKLAPSDHLNSISGAYLQMQRELQWFKGVENMMLEKDKFKRNRDGYTAQHIFTEEHKELMEKGEKLLKDTSGSCMVVAALIATVAFAAAFTAPGGNISDSNSTKNGTPVFLDETSFVVFAVADAIALFSSVTSVLMFLAIYTSRYAEGDFLKSLPQKLIVGLVTLFISMATILVAFGASLYIVLGERFSWGLIPIALLSCVPSTLFASLQLPLFLEMVRSTYWSSPLRKHRYIPNHQLSVKKDV